jgi:hypothetical protein
MEIKSSVEDLRKRTLMIGAPLYGGQCTGSFMKSMIEFMVLATKYGLDVKPYFIYNESLITRARNYIADEFMRSNYSRLLFIDSDIGFNAEHIIHMLALQTDDSEYDVLCGPYPKKCLSGTSRIRTQDGEKTIAELYDIKYDGLIESVDANGNIALKKITNFWKEKNHHKQFVGLRTSKNRPRNFLVLTDDHEVSCVADPLNPKIEYRPAGNMKGSYIVKRPNTINKNKFNALFNKEQLSAFVGTILGDGHIGTNGSWSSNTGPKQKAYENYKRSTLNNFGANAQTKVFRDLIYPNGIKSLKNVMNYIDPISLAFLYMDDGSSSNSHLKYRDEYMENSKTNEHSWWTDGVLAKRSMTSPGDNFERGRKTRSDVCHQGCTIATHHYTKEENELLLKTIQENFGITGRIYTSTVANHKKTENRIQPTRDEYYYINFLNEDADKFFDLIAEYIHPSMRYKLPEKYQGSYEFKEIDSKSLDYGLIEITDVVPVNTSSHLYDIEVENTHNFFANDFLVHNCISWEKVKAAVDKGVADEDPSVLENYIGDFVFNPVFDKDKKQTTMRLDEPVEVLESGTGFMMIHRKAFEKFDAAYGDAIRYKPDHVRTKNFDGSKEISMYFQAEIDQETKRYLSEDYWFCSKLRKAGGKVWLAPWINLSHHGSYVFGGSLAALASVGASATAGKNVPKR